MYDREEMNMWDMSHIFPTVTAYVLFYVLFNGLFNVLFYVLFNVLFYVLFYVLFSCILYDHKIKFSFEKFSKVSCIRTHAPLSTFLRLLITRIRHYPRDSLWWLW